MKRRGSFGIGGFIGLIIIASVFGDFAIGFIGVLMMALFVAVPLAAIVFLIKAIKSGDKNKKADNNVTNKTIHKSGNNISAANLNKINTRLKKYFESNVYLPIIKGLCFTTRNGVFESLDQLYLTYEGEKIQMLGEFKDRHRDMYDQLIKLLVAFSKEDDAVMTAEVDIEPVKEDRKVNTIKLSQAQSYIDKINALNAAIPNEEITNGLYQTCDFLKQIDLAASKDDNLTKLYDYYLPILVNILESYKSLQNVDNEESRKTQAQLIKTIILINEALKTIYNSLHEEDYMNLNADMSTLQTLLKKDGYGDDPFGGK